MTRIHLWPRIVVMHGGQRSVGMWAVGCYLGESAVKTRGGRRSSGALLLARLCCRSARAGGMSTASITWMMPFDVFRSTTTILAALAVLSFSTTVGACTSTSIVAPLSVAGVVPPSQLTTARRVVGVTEDVVRQDRREGRDIGQKAVNNHHPAAPRRRHRSERTPYTGHSAPTGRQQDPQPSRQRPAYRSRHSPTPSPRCPAAPKPHRSHE